MHSNVPWFDDRSELLDIVEYCCYTSHTVRHASVEFINDTMVIVTCDTGFSHADGELSHSYSCEDNPNWELQYKPSCTRKT